MGGELIWELITELENFKVFLGKKDKHDVRSLDSIIGNMSKISFEPKLIYGAMLLQLSLNPIAFKLSCIHIR
jgi:hypothetical protein